MPHAKLDPTTRMKGMIGLYRTSLARRQPGKESLEGMIHWSSFAGVGFLLRAGAVHVSCLDYCGRGMDWAFLADGGSIRWTKAG